MTEVDDKTKTLEFESERDKDQIMDLSLWSVQGHCLNLKECKVETSLEEINFDVMHIWIQIYDLNMDMYNAENAYQIGNSVGKCIDVESDHLMQQ